jgi:hypothetical protein
MSMLAKELVDLRPDTLGVTTPVIGALARETRTIPIVFTGVSDPIGSGYRVANNGGPIAKLSARRGVAIRACTHKCRGGVVLACQVFGCGSI